MNVAALLLLVMGQSPTQAADARLGNLLVTSAWSRPTPPAAAVGAVYFSITNLGSTPDRLVALSSAIASTVEIHESHRAEGVVAMRAVAAVECPPGVTVRIEPGGLHVMLIGLARPLIAGTAFALLLQFRDAGVLTLQVPVENKE
jgi:copper(I)-binding protein